MCSLDAEVKLLPHGVSRSADVIKAHGLRGSHSPLSSTRLCENSKGFSKSENKRLHMLALCKINFKLIASS